jgi:hypothetical protein
LGRIITAITIQKDNYFRRPGRPGPGQTHRSIAAVGFVDNPGTGGYGLLCGTIGGAIVGHNYFIHQISGNRADHPADGLFFIKRGNYNGYFHPSQLRQNMNLFSGIRFYTIGCPDLLDNPSLF